MLVNFRKQSNAADLVINRLQQMSFEEMLDFLRISNRFNLVHFGLRLKLDRYILLHSDPRRSSNPTILEH